mmetsp:Transcript_28385/g.80124  ORF Transcript_28385/g.80124 Transcript_28385/m.80124 type:complete len:205 (+) Transcript_28385:1288-1902(+)
MIRRVPGDLFPAGALMLEGTQNCVCALHLHGSIAQILGELVPVRQGALVLEAQLLQAALDSSQCGALALEPLTPQRHLLLRLLQGLCLRYDDALGLVVQVDGQYPSAQAGGSFGHLGDRPGVELGLGGEEVHLLDNILWDGVLVKRQQDLHEVELPEQLHALPPPQCILHVGFKLPAVTDRLGDAPQHDADGLEDKLHASRGVL